MALLKQCRCGKSIPMSDKQCDTCIGVSDGSHKLYDKYRRDKQSSSFYRSKAWRVKRQEALTRENNLCVHCLFDKKIKKADMVDHITPLKVDWSLRLNINNLQPLCNAHHNVKTSLERKG